jgi:hypothetical protein
MQMVFDAGKKKISAPSPAPLAAKTGAETVVVVNAKKGALEAQRLLQHPRDSL